MQYREVGDTGIRVSALGFGTMRFKGADNAAQVIRRGLELGINYFDIGGAYSWESPEENAETWVGRAIEGHPRETLVLSAKAQCRPGDEPSPRVEAGLGVRNRDEMWRCIEGSLRRIGVEQLDFYQLWDMSTPEHFDAACTGAHCPLRAMREARDQGLVRHLGFTSHGRPPDIIDWLKRVPDFRTTTVYYNFLDRYCEQVLDYARENNIGVHIMGPLRGGLLVGHSGAFARRLPELGKLPVQQLALRFLLSNPGVTCVLTGANRFDNLEENAAVVDQMQRMSPAQQGAFVAAFTEFSRGQPLCTGCRYCGGACPEGLSVYQLMGLYQGIEIFEMESAREQLQASRDKKNMDASRCVTCEKCVEACPQDLPIPDRMERLAELIGGAPGE